MLSNLAPYVPYGNTIRSSLLWGLLCYSYYCHMIGMNIVVIIRSSPLFVAVSVRKDLVILTIGVYP